MTVDTQKGVTVASCICSCGMNCQSFHWLSEVSGVWVCEIHICAVVIEGKIERNLFRLQPFFFLFLVAMETSPFRLRDSDRKLKWSCEKKINS